METIEDIVADMRCGMIPKHRHDRELLMKYADRIESAVKALEADRDNWRKQALAEDARANAATCKESLQVGNAARCKELLGEVYGLLDKSKSYIIDVESIGRKKELSHYLTRAKNLVDNMISQELNANVKVDNEAKLREALDEIRVAAMSDYEPDADHLIEKCNAALSTPARNCELYTVGEALRKYGFPTKSKPWGEKEWLDFCEYLYAEAKGEMK